MLNYANINDVEFEYLCQDIMSKKLGITLRRFAAGRDGGIDLTESSFKPKIIVQVKHYTKTSIHGLINSLRKEIDKVKENNPEQYYVCCSKELSPDKINEIYEMFFDYMHSEENIITINEIEDFLLNGKNIDILRKHFKLWISSTGILQDLFSNDIFIDCEALLSTIHRDEQYFVQTSAYNQALNCLSKNKTLFLTGDPGVGKTVTSKMLILNYAADGYRIKYTTDVTDLASLKRALSQDRDAKEVILLDDCFGQAYFEMKTSQGTELLSLIKYINVSKNKLLILNSRITIYQEAQKRTPELVNSFENKEFKVQIINMSAMSDMEKAKILYNHMYFNTQDEKYFQAIKQNHNYRTIINHKNYNPRIIEFISNPYRYKDISAAQYFTFVKSCLDNPHMVWDNEYEERIQAVDRCLLMTLFSISNTSTSYELAKKCFLKRIDSLLKIDTTVDQFERSLARLQESFVKIVDEKGCKKISMVNPSVNDYLRFVLDKNPLEYTNVLNSICSIPQYKRMFSAEESKAQILALFDTGAILDVHFENEDEKSSYITAFVAINSIQNILYKPHIEAFIKNAEEAAIYDEPTYHLTNVLINLFDEKLFCFYKLEDFFLDFNNLQRVLSKFDLRNLAKILSVCYHYFEGEDGFSDMCEELINEAISWHCCDVDASSFDVDVWKHVKESEEVFQCGPDEYGSEPNIDDAIDSIEDEIKEIVEKEIDEIITNLPGDLSDGWFVKTPYDITVQGADDMVHNHLQSDYDDDDRYDREPSNISDIDLIFNR